MYFSRLYHVRSGGSLNNVQGTMFNEHCTVSLSFYLFICFILASDTQSSFSDYTSLSNDDHEGRYDHDAAAGIIFIFPSLFSHILTNTLKPWNTLASPLLGAVHL